MYSYTKSAAAAASRCCCWVSRTRSIFALCPSGALLSIVHYLDTGGEVGAIAPTGTTKAHRRYRDHLWTFAVYRSPVDV